MEGPVKIFVATPMYGGMCHAPYTLGMINLVHTFAEYEVPFQFSYLMNESLITRARNTLAYDFLESDCTHLMFIDSDIGFSPIDILMMVSASRDIICGIYPKKEINWPLIHAAVQQGVPMEKLSNYTGAFVFNSVDDEKEATGYVNQPMQISNGGTGFMLIQRKVFEDLQGKVPTYTSDMVTMVEQGKTEPKVMDEFFVTSIDEQSNRLLSEDYHFCKIARQEGFTVWAAPWVNLTHCGAYLFNGKLPRI